MTHTPLGFMLRRSSASSMEGWFATTTRGRELSGVEISGEIERRASDSARSAEKKRRAPR